jgi:hypothetical protein
MTFRKGNAEHNTSAAFGRILRPNVAAVLFENRTADGKANAKAVALRRMKRCK